MQHVLADEFDVDGFVESLEEVGIVEAVDFGGQHEEAVGDRLEAAELVEVGDVVVEVGRSTLVGLDPLRYFVNNVAEGLAHPENRLPV